MNKIGCEPLKLNYEWRRDKMWTPLNWPCIVVLVVTGHVLFMWYTPRKHVRCNFLNDAWLQNLEISILFMLAFYRFLTKEVECLNTDTIKYLPIRRLWKSNTATQYLVFLSLSLDEKKRVHPFCVVWQSSFQCKVARLTNNEI